MQSYRFRGDLNTRLIMYSEDPKNSVCSDFEWSKRGQLCNVTLSKSKMQWQEVCTVSSIALLLNVIGQDIVFKLHKLLNEHEHFNHECRAYKSVFSCMVCGPYFILGPMPFFPLRHPSFSVTGSAPSTPLLSPKS